MSSAKVLFELQMFPNEFSHWPVFGSWSHCFYYIVCSLRHYFYFIVGSLCHYLHCRQFVIIFFTLSAVCAIIFITLLAVCDIFLLHCWQFVPLFFTLSAVYAIIFYIVSSLCNFFTLSVVGTIIFFNCWQFVQYFTWLMFWYNVGDTGQLWACPCGSHQGTDWPNGSCKCGRAWTNHADTDRCCQDACHPSCACSEPGCSRFQTITKETCW